MPKVDDSHKKTYTDIRKSKKIDWQTNTVRIELEEIESLDNFFVSSVAKKHYNSTETRFDAIEFHFHSPSEHTLNGKYYDLEMHLVHKRKNADPKNNIQYAVVGMFFSVEEYDRSITQNDNQTLKNFFNDLRFDDLGEPVVNSI